MALIIPDGFGQVLHQIRLAGDNEPMAVTYGVAIDAGGLINPAAAANDIHDAFHAAISSQLGTSYTLYQTEIKWKEAAVADLRVVIHVEPKAFVGTLATLPQNTAALVQKRTAVAGRRNRGRFYLPGIGESVVDNIGQITPANVAAMNADLGLFLGKFGTTFAQLDAMVVLHNTGISGAPSPTPVTQLLVDPIVATQRRRLRR